MIEWFLHICSNLNSTAVNLSATQTFQLSLSLFSCSPVCDFWLQQNTTDRIALTFLLGLCTGMCYLVKKCVWKLWDMVCYTVYCVKICLFHILKDFLLLHTFSPCIFQREDFTLYLTTFTVHIRPGHKTKSAIKHNEIFLKYKCLCLNNNNQCLMVYQNDYVHTKLNVHFADNSSVLLYTSLRFRKVDILFRRV